MSNLFRNWFAQPWALLLLLALPALALLGVWARHRRRQALLLMGNGTAFEMLTPRRQGWRRIRGLMLVLGLILLIVGIAGPQWGLDWSQSTAQGRDIVVVLDLSRSMYAENPTRLSRAREALLDLTQALREQGGHRVALITFAGRPRVLCPLTHDYDHFETLVLRFEDDYFDPRLKPSETTPSGTRMGAALEMAVEMLQPLHAEREDSLAGAQDILLISDGDDPAEEEAGKEEWRRGALAARGADIPIHTIGIGNPDVASEVPGYTDKKTRLEEKPLREIMRLTGGTYTPVHDKQVSLGELFRTRIASGSRREHTEDALPVYRQRYAWFLAPAFVFLAGALLIGDGRRPLAA